VNLRIWDFLLLRSKNIPVLSNTNLREDNRSRDNAGIDAATFAQHQAMVLEVGIDLLEDLLAQLVLLQEMTEVEDGRLVGQSVGQPKHGKAAHRLDFVKCIFHRRIEEVVEQLHAVNAQHRAQRIGRATGSSLRVVTLELLLQPLPGDQYFHALHKSLAPRLALLVLVFHVGKAHLIHRNFSSWWVMAILSQIRELCRPSLGNPRRS
jgi:hypothetical protein